MIRIHNNEEFDKLYSFLNGAQKKAVDTIEGPVVVIAGPGTGKTTVLTLRIANILRKTDTAPENILALTFTESGAYVMRRKLVEIIGSSAYKVNIHTFHGFAEKIIREYPDYFARIIGSKIITDAEQIKIIESLIQSKNIKVLRPYGDPNYYVKSVLNEIHILKKENISPKKLIESIRIDKTADVTSKSDKEPSRTEIEKLEKRNEKNLELAWVYDKYEKELAKQKYYDFDDMLLELISAMENDPLFKLMIQETYQYILADEHQDANAAQNRILELLADFHESPNLFIVGDDKQAIYRFQGASLENFLFFSKKYKDAVVIELTHNYRSHQGILDASHSLIENNPAILGYVRPKLISLQIGSKPIFVDELPTKKEELEYLATIIEKLIKKGEKPEEIAVLYRENKEAKAVSDSLRTHGVISRIESDHNIMDDVDSSKIIILCRAIYDPSDDDHLAQALLLSEMACDPASVCELFKFASRERISLHRVIDEITRYSFLQKTISGNRLKEITIAYARILKWSNQAQTLAFPDFLQKLIQETNLVVSVVEAPNSLERLASLEVFFDRAVKASLSKQTFRLKDYIEYIDIIRNHGIMSKMNFTEHTGGVRLMTAHRAKGLEFNHVFITNASHDTWGNRIRRNHFSIPIIEHARDTGRIEDERRLFYVALTRARESVNILYSRFSEDKEAVRSQFISEIDQSLISFDKPVILKQDEAIVQKMKTPYATPAVSILDADFVKLKFLSQPFSITHLNNYLECPWRYFFVNLVRIPQAQNKHQMYGTAIHETLRSFFEAYKDNRNFPKKKLLEIFKYNLNKQPMSSSDREESWEKGSKALQGYYLTYDDMWNRNLLTEYAVKAVGFKLDTGENIHLTGKLDKIDFLNESDVIVVDFKTSKPKSRNDIEGKTKTSDGNYKRQLVFYKLLLDEDKKFSMKSGEIDFIEPNERGIYKKERFDITDREVETLIEQIKQTAKEITSLSFVDSTCNEKDCSYCRLGKILKSYGKAK